MSPKVPIVSGAKFEPVTTTSAPPSIRKTLGVTVFISGAPTVTILTASSSELAPASSTKASVPLTITFTALLKLTPGCAN
ncbi:MAG: hypothetical protein FD167_125 [bacterium]|nr:MAG: hypothetical protein FD167_125 [bacterium]